MDTGADVTRPTYNLCGGLNDLLVNGESVRPGSDCGAFDDGILVCNGRDALRCIFATEPNECGGPGDLPAELGSACGCAGEIVCAEDGGVECADTVQRNSCGGCDVLEGRPGFFCERESAQGRYVCQTFDSLICVGGAGNACGGEAPLRLVVAGQNIEEGEVLDGVFPGDACTTACGTGRYVCDGVDGLRCQPERPCNRCGGTRSLSGIPTTTCGACGQGRWACSGVDAVTCAGAVTPNVCGGCDPLSIAPGEFCANASGVGGDEVEGVALCRDGGVACSALAIGVGDTGAPELNDCGGASTLRVPVGLPSAGQPAELGAVCGTCSRGVLVCAGAEAVRCTVDEANQRNVCNGCDTIVGRLDAPCGTCGSGRLTCSETAQFDCNGDLGEEFGRNACGGCGSLPGVVSGSCGSCLVWACDGVRLECTPTTEGAACSGLVVCADLECAAQNRACTETDGLVDARCGGCLSGNVRDDVADDDSCRPVLTCGDVSENCVAEGRVCVDGTLTTDATCGDCEPAFVDDGGTCREPLLCTDLDCFADLRDCTFSQPGRDAFCADCIFGYDDPAGTCEPIDCGELAAPDNGTVEATSTIYGSEATYFCNEGADLLGEAVRECQATGAWSGEAPVCELAECPEPSDPNSAIAYFSSEPGTERLVGASIDFICFFDQGYVVAPNTSGRTNAIFVCGSDGNWEGEGSTLCVRRICDAPPPAPAPAILEEVVRPDDETENVAGTVLRWMCIAGYSTIPESIEAVTVESSCDINGEWSAPQDCLPVECGTLPAPVNGSVDTPGGTTFGQVAEYACGAGYTLVGVANPVCSNDGEWSSPPPVCTEDVVVGELCEIDTECNADEWCPTNTMPELQRCSPVGQYAWFSGNAGNRSQPVGVKQPNEYGLYDMSGNVLEWVWDRYSSSYPSGSASEYTGPSTGSFRGFRGGSWFISASGLRSAYRDNCVPTNRDNGVGLRLARTVP
jgi:hypothetical protein